MDTYLIQLVTAFLGTIGFSLIFNVSKKHILPAALGGFLTWAIFLICDAYFGLGALMSAVIAAAGCQAYAEIMARVFKTPTTTFFISAIVPLIPGGSLYNTMYAAVFRDWAAFADYGIKTLEYTLGIAIGLSFVTATLYIVANGAKMRKHK